MTAALEAMRLRASADRRHAIVEAWISMPFMVMTCLLAAQGEAWHAAATAFIAGALLSVAILTAIRGRTWERVADEREPRPTHPGWTSDTAGTNNPKEARDAKHTGR